MTMELIDYKSFAEISLGMLGRDVECHADVVLPELSGAQS